MEDSLFEYEFDLPSENETSDIDVSFAVEDDEQLVNPGLWHEESDSDDAEFNPFLAYGEDDGDDPHDPAAVFEENVPEVVMNDPMQAPGEEPGLNGNLAVRPNEWIPEKLVYEIEKKPAVNRLNMNLRGTYMYAAVYGEEDLNAVRELHFEECDVLCPNCYARHWKAETDIQKGAGLHCCRYGRFELPEESEFRRPNDEIVSFFLDNDDKARKFQQNILKYNRIFATAFLSGDYQNVGFLQPAFGR